MAHLNVEIKATCDDTHAVRQVLKALNADFRGLDHQVDTYFHIPQGRLKLREGNIENYLIFYDREDQPGPKNSEVTLASSGKSAPALKAVLERALGVLMTVVKDREIYFIENVKFHIDQVEGLGNFVEIEAIDSKGDLGREQLLKQCHDFMERLLIREEKLVARSYSDLLLAQKKA